MGRGQVLGSGTPSSRTQRSAAIQYSCGSVNDAFFRLLLPARRKSGRKHTSTSLYDFGSPSGRLEAGTPYRAVCNLAKRGSAHKSSKTQKLLSEPYRLGGGRHRQSARRGHQRIDAARRERTHCVPPQRATPARGEGAGGWAVRRETMEVGASRFRRDSHPWQQHRPRACVFGHVCGYRRYAPSQRRGPALCTASKGEAGRASQGRQADEPLAQRSLEPQAATIDTAQLNTVCSGSWRRIGREPLTIVQAAEWR
jgi:hypothetical protein